MPKLLWGQAKCNGALNKTHIVSEYNIMVSYNRMNTWTVTLRNKQKYWNV